MKKLLSIIAALAIFGSFSSVLAQNYSFEKVWPDDARSSMFVGGTGAHGCAVSPDGKIWMVMYGGPGQDSIVVSPTYTKKSVNSIIVFNPDGTEAAIGRVKVCVYPGGVDTLTNAYRGMSIDEKGNPMVAAYDGLYRIDYKTGQCLGKLIPTASTSLTSPGIDDEGNVYTSHVSGGYPIKEYSSDFSFIGNDIDTVPDLGRTLAVSKDGLTLYAFRFSPGTNYVYTRPDKFSSFVKAGTIFDGTKVESCCWHPVTGDLWFSCGSYNDKPADTAQWVPGTWYGYNTKTNAITGSMRWNFKAAGSVNERPRAIAFSPDGEYAYVGAFGDNSFPAFQRFKKGGDGVVKENGAVVNGFELSQNYPNPFNPTTNIRFSVPKDGMVSLNVYNLLGQKVATLVSEQLTAGTYNTSFDASKLASGTYVYQIKANGFTATKKMMLMK